MKKKSKAKKQVAALPFRARKRGLEILLVTSRETRRWVIPKGWPMKGKKDWNAAAREAYEEAGVEGKVGHKTLGSYVYQKRLVRGFITCEVFVYPLDVREELAKWPEAGERKRKWFPARKAAKLVNEEGLQAIIEATLA